MKKDIIIIGAGAAGLMAARELSVLGYKVTLLEAMPHPGGRIHTIQGFKQAIEAGAEFVHGDLPFTISLLKEAGTGVTPFKGEIWEHKDGRVEEEDSFFETNKAFRERLQQLEEDITVADFFDKYFREEKYAAFRQSIIRYIEGYEAADIRKASMLAMKGNLLAPEEEQYRPSGGYSRLVEYLVKQCLQNGCRIIFNSPVTEVYWEKGKVRAITDNGNYTAEKLLCTVSLGILGGTSNNESAINFHPAITAKEQAARKLGWGTVIKVLLEFTHPFWCNAEVQSNLGKNTADVGFIFSQQPIPTWWTQLPANSNLLTGWLAGPAAEKVRKDDNEIVNQALESLAVIFKISAEQLGKYLTASHVANWGNMPFVKGAYSYKMVNYELVVQELAKPEAGTLFFAGEAIYIGPYSGTVEAALASAVNVIKDIRDS